MRVHWVGALFFIFAASTGIQAGVNSSQKMPEDWVDLSRLDPSILVEMRLAQDHNFVGRPVVGYHAPKCLLTRRAAEALVAVQSELKPKHLALKVYDCFRPQRAVEDLLRWGQDLRDMRMKEEFYPHIDKTILFTGGYLAKRSSHSRGSAVDLTLVPIPPRAQASYHKKMQLKSCTLPPAERFDDNSLDMGTGYSCFDPISAVDVLSINPQAKKNRETLVEVMSKHGFKVMPLEWWHFTLVHEPYPQGFFDFEIR